MMKEISIPIEVSARHIHLTQEDINALFGEGYELKKLKDLSQADDFAAEETVDVEINGREIKGIRIVGAPREYTQLELTASDAYYFKTEVPLRLSGNIEGTLEMKIKGKEEIVKEEGAIIAKRHLHISPQEAEEYGLKNEEEISIQCGEERKTTFHKVVVRVKEGFKLAFHIDIDEANTAGIKNTGEGKMV